MRKVFLKLVAAIASIFVSGVLITYTGLDIFFYTFLAGLVAIVLYWLDLAHEARSARNLGIPRFILIFLGIPQALLGLVCLSFGIAMVLWVLYNSLIERQPEYSGGFFTFGIGPICIVFGGGWLWSAFRRSPPSNPR